MAQVSGPLRRSVLEALVPVVNREKGDTVANDRLMEFIQANIPVESLAEQKRRGAKVREFRNMFRDWVKRTCLAQGLPEEAAELAGGEVFISGSYKLNVHEPGADIDVCCVVPMYIKREHFFGSLQDMLKSDPRITEVVAAPSARVPVMSFSFEGVDFDLLFARLHVTTVHEDHDIDDDAILRNLDDEKTYLSLNGPRTTNMIYKLIPETARDSFLHVLRVVRQWAKRRGLYGNKYGYLGGVNFNILVAVVCQMFPNALPAYMLMQFFAVFSKWQWPVPVQLCKPFDANITGYKVWRENEHQREVMPILTPAYPAGNSSYNVSTYTLSIMLKEFRRGQSIMERIYHKARGRGWSELLEPSDFFIAYKYYLAIDVQARGEEEQSRWFGFVESRLRIFIETLGMVRVLTTIHLFPREFKAYIPKPDFNFSECFYIGLEVQESDVRDDKINISTAVEQFREDVENRSSFLPRSHYNQRLPDGCDLDVYSVPYKKLPDAVFESFGGKKIAMEMRKARRAKEPKTKKRSKKDKEDEGAPKGQAEGSGEEEGPAAKKAKVEDEAGATVASIPPSSTTAAGTSEGGTAGEVEGRTALHTASMLGNLEQVEALLKESPNQLNAVDGGGKTPLDLAILHGKLDVVDFLREEGALAPMEAARLARFLDEDVRKKLTRSGSTKEAEYDFVDNAEEEKDNGEEEGGGLGDTKEGGEGIVEVEGVVRTHEDLIHFAPHVPKWRRPQRLPRSRPIRTPVHFVWAAGV